MSHFSAQDDFNEIELILLSRDASERAAVSTAVILLAFSNIAGFVVPADAQGLKETVKKHVDVLLEDFNDDEDLLRYTVKVSSVS